MPGDRNGHLWTALQAPCRAEGIRSPGMSSPFGHVRGQTPGVARKAMGSEEEAGRLHAVGRGNLALVGSGEPPVQDGRLAAHVDPLRAMRAGEDERG